MKTLRRIRLTYANVIATLALFAALGGTSYALSGVPDGGGAFHGCVSKRTGLLRVVKTARACQKARAHGKHRDPGEFAVTWNQQGRQGVQGNPGQNGAQGAPGQDATKLFAAVSDNGGANAATVSYGNGVTAVSDPAGDNAYTVTFNRSLDNCVVQAIAGIGHPNAGASSILGASPNVSVNPGNPATVHVDFQHVIGGSVMATDTSFMITAFC